MDIVKAVSWNSYIKLSNESRDQLKFWERNLTVLNKRYLQNAGDCSRIVFSDASNTGYAGYEVHTKDGIAHGMWEPGEINKSSAWRELCAVYRVLVDIVSLLKNQRVKWFTDNQAVAKIVEKGSMKQELQNFAMLIFDTCCKNSIQLEVEWIPRDKNEKADYLSRIVEKDDWGISFELLNLIQDKWGTLEIDYFASKHNAKLPVFFSRFWCENTAGIDAFTYNWGGHFGLFVPPVILVVRVLQKMKFCKARGVLVVPKWKTANYWPLICPENGEFASGIKDLMCLPTSKEFYTPCQNKIGMFGVKNLSFDMLAILLDFR